MGWKKMILMNSINIISLHKFIVSILLISAVFGYVIGIEKLYLFHLFLVIYWFFVLISYIHIKSSVLNSIKIPLLFLLFMIISLFWSLNLNNGLRYLFYFLCGYTIVFAIINYAVDLNKQKFIFKILAIFFLLNFFIGLLETTGYFRLPMSPYYNIFSTYPSGFNSNLNNFGFVFIIIFPFMFLYPNNIIKVTSILLAIWFAISIGSKGFFLSLLYFFILIFFIDIKKISTWKFALNIGLFALLTIICLTLVFGNIELNNRIFSTFEQILRGFELFLNKDFSDKDSTGIRAYFYFRGFEELISSNGLGIGIAGIATTLANESNLYINNYEIISFHNFFLELLVDFGIIPFLIIIFSYLYLAIKNIKYSKITKNAKLSYFLKASGVSLFVILPASISPSSIIYIFTFWIVLGFSISSYLIFKKYYTTNIRK